MAQERGLGKCSQDHINSYGFPTRPETRFAFFSQCGNRMVWECGNCKASVPDDGEELAVARFCRECGTPYFDSDDDSVDPALRP